MKRVTGKKRFFLLLISGTVIVGLGVLAVTLKHGRKRGVQYQLTKVTRGEVRQTILSTGVVAPENRLDLKAPVAGRIEKVLVVEGQRVKQNQVLAWMSSTERAALIDTARSKGPEEVAYWEASYKMTPILAPGRGLVILKSVDAGQTVTQTDAILSMSDRLWVKANVDETDLAEVRLGQRATIVLDAFPGSVLPSKVMHIGYDAKTVNNVTTYEVDVAADDTPLYMKSGMTANVTFFIAERDQALLVPAGAVHRDKKKSFVMIPNPEPEGSPLEQGVEVGISDGKKVEVLSGLAEGDAVLNASVRSVSQKEDRVKPFSAFGGGAPPGGPGGGRR